MKNQIKIFNRSLGWIKASTISGNGITVTSKQNVIYPEVTGYYIPTLLEWGERDLAVSYAKYLCSIQKKDGSWYDAYDKAPYIFDSAQILKGLISIKNILPEVESHIVQGCDWLIGNMDENGRLVTPSKDAWGNDDNFCSELIHLYCLTPLVDAAVIFNRADYKKAADKICDFYKRNYIDKILNFSLLSHFYAYVMEGLLDLGESETVKQAMNNLKKYQNPKGGVPGLKDVNWICSTGLFQLALVWYKLGELEKGNHIFDYACKFQNESGGWFGSYPASWTDKLRKGKQKAYYFPDEEISWANKYFLDALAYKTKLEFESQADIFQEKIDINDGRYQLIENRLTNIMKNRSEGTVAVCDIGCGKGRYIQNLVMKYPNNKYYACDLSHKVMDGLKSPIEKKQGRLTCIPYHNAMFDFVYVCEALEHAINLEGSLKEIFRVLKPDGIAVIIDKPVEQLGKLKIEDWEQWIDDEQLSSIVQQLGGGLEIIKSVAYEGKMDGLFRAWIIKK